MPKFSNLTWEGGGGKIAEMSELPKQFSKALTQFFRSKREESNRASIEIALKW